MLTRQLSMSLLNGGLVWKMAYDITNCHPFLSTFIYVCYLSPFKVRNLLTICLCIFIVYMWSRSLHNMLPNVCTLYVVSTCCMFHCVFACCSLHFVYTLYLWGNEGKVSMMWCRLSSMMMTTKNGYLTSILLHTTLNLRWEGGMDQEQDKSYCKHFDKLGDK
jgi:hypothetical protein